MTKERFDIRMTVLIVILVSVGVWRVVNTSMEMSVWTNFSPIGAMALFAGTYFINRTKALITPLVILFVSDLIIMQVFYAEFSQGLLYSGWYWTYGSFLIMVLIGEKLRSGNVIKSIFLGSLLVGLTHFLVSNFGVWVSGGLNMTTGMPYSRNFSGLIECYTLALPFFRNFLVGTLIFSAILFGAFEFSKWKYPILKIAS